MNPRYSRALSLIGLCCVIAGCTSVGATKRGAVGYNRVFADARNEVLLLNILRARDGEPQQFSTISTVTGNMRPEMKLAAELDNLIAGATKIFKPSAEYGLRNPSVTIAPLETKEFRRGMVKPVEINLIDQLLNAGWPQPVVLHLALAGVRCDPKSVMVPEPLPAEFPRSATWRRIGDAEATNVGRAIRVPAAEGAKMLREGAGDGLKLELAKSEQGDPEGTIRLQFKQPAPGKITVQMAGLCSGRAIGPDNLVMRSPVGMIIYLGTLAKAGGNEFFSVKQGPIPRNALVGTRFRGQLYYVPPDPQPARTLSLLAEIIGFQTTDATLESSKPTLTVPQ